MATGVDRPDQPLGLIWLARVTRSWWWWAPAVLGLILRAITIPAVYPYIHYVDSPLIVHNAADMVNRLPSPEAIDPKFYEYGYPSIGLAFVLLTGWAVVQAALTGSSLTTPFPLTMDPYMLSPSGAHLMLLLVWALIGATTVALAALAAGQIAGRTAGLSAGVLLAVAPVPVEFAQVVVTDAITALLASALLFVSARWATGRSGSAVVACGVLIGIATANKYNAALLAIVPLSLIVSGARAAGLPTTLRRLVSLGAAFTIALVVSMPMIVLRPSSVRAGLTNLASIYYGGTADPASSALFNQLTYYRSGLGGVWGAILVCTGIVLALTRRDHRLWSIAWLAYIVASIALLVSQRQDFHRNLLPTYPVLAALAGVGAAVVVRWLRQGWRATHVSGSRSGRALWAPALVVAGVLFVMVPILGRDATRGIERAAVRDNRTQAISWLKSAVCPSERGRLIILTEVWVHPEELPRNCAASVMVRSLDALDDLAPGDLVVAPVMVTAVPWYADRDEFRDDPAALARLLPRLETVWQITGGPMTQAGKVPSVAGHDGPGIVIGRFSG